MISIIVPVYNAEKTIRRCIESILAQTYENFELLLIDDGAKDLSPTIIDEYAETDIRIKVFHKENGGTASARNYGLEKASRQYIGFVDDDDYVHPTMYERLLKGFEHPSVDISCCQFKAIYEIDKPVFIAPPEKKEIRFPDNNKQEIIFQRPSAIEEYLHEQLFSVSVWDKLFKRQLFNSIKFDTKNYYEDKRISFDLISLANSIFVSKEILYFYFVHNTSKARTIKPSNLQEFLRISEEIAPIISKQYPHLEGLSKCRIAKDNFKIAKWILDKNDFKELFYSAQRKMRLHKEYFLADKHTKMSEKMMFLFIVFGYPLAKWTKRISKKIKLLFE